MKYVVEHMEPDLSPWSLVEYQNISKIVGKTHLIFTNTAENKLKKLGTIQKEPVYQLNLKKACLLDPSAKETLKPSDAQKFDYLIFGGILGDYPRKKRTKPLAQKLQIPTRNIGKKQMSTDNAVLTCFLIMQGTPFEKIKFKDIIRGEIEFDPSSFGDFIISMVINPGCYLLF